MARQGSRAASWLVAASVGIVIMAMPAAFARARIEPTPRVGYSGAVVLRLEQGTSRAQLAQRVEWEAGTISFWLPQIHAAVIMGVSHSVAATWPEVVAAVGDPLIASPEIQGQPATPTPEEERWNIKQVRADEAAAAGHTGQGTIVAVIDSGIFYPHPELFESYIGGRNFIAEYCGVEVDPGCDPNDPIDWGGHGTFIAGIIAAARDGQGVVGVAPETKLLAARVCGLAFGCPTAAVAAALVYAADEGADVANISLNALADLEAPHNQEELAVVMDAVRYARQKGVVIVGATGNNGEHVTAESERKPMLGYVDSADEMIMTTATGPGGKTAVSDWCDFLTGRCDPDDPEYVGIPYSNTGDFVELAAPGGDWRGIPSGGPVREVPDPEPMILSTWSPLSPFASLYMVSTGTSAAAPHVSGGAALLAGMGMDDPREIRNAIYRSAADEGDPRKDDVYGHGRLDVFAAIRAVSQERE